MGVVAAVEELEVGTVGVVAVVEELEAGTVGVVAAVEELEAGTVGVVAAIKVVPTLVAVKEEEETTKEVLTMLHSSAIFPFSKQRYGTVRRILHVLVRTHARDFANCTRTGFELLVSLTCYVRTDGWTDGHTWSRSFTPGVTCEMSRTLRESFTNFFVHSTVVGHMYYYIIHKIGLIIVHCETASCSESPDPSSFPPPPCHWFPAARRVWPRMSTV